MIAMDIDLEKIIKKVDALESKVSQLEKLHKPAIVKPDTERVQIAVNEYLESSRELRNFWMGKRSSVDEVRVMRRHSRGY